MFILAKQRFKNIQINVIYNMSNKSHKRDNCIFHFVMYRQIAGANYRSPNICTFFSFYKV